MNDTERAAREFAWLIHGHDGIYGDDGEMQCVKCSRYGVMDYKRQPLVEVLAAATKAIQDSVAASKTERDALARERDGLQCSLDRLHGRKFSDRMYEALYQRANVAESRLAALRVGLQEIIARLGLEPAWSPTRVIGERLDALLQRESL